MSKPALLNDKAYAALKNAAREGESLSDVILRYVPPPIKTFGDLERHLNNIEGPMFDDMAALDRVLARKGMKPLPPEKKGKRRVRH